MEALRSGREESRRTQSGEPMEGNRLWMVHASEGAYKLRRLPGTSFSILNARWNCGWGLLTLPWGSPWHSMRTSCMTISREYHEMHTGRMSTHISDGARTGMGSLRTARATSSIKRWSRGDSQWGCRRHASSALPQAGQGRQPGTGNALTSWHSVTCACSRGKFMWVRTSPLARIMSFVSLALSSASFRNPGSTDAMPGGQVDLYSQTSTFHDSHSSYHVGGTSCSTTQCWAGDRRKLLCAGDVSPQGHVAGCQHPARTRVPAESALVDSCSYNCAEVHHVRTLQTVEIAEAIARTRHKVTPPAPLVKITRRS